MADCSFSLALCTENKCFPTIYYVLVGHENLWIPLSDSGKSMVKKKPEGYPLIILIIIITSIGCWIVLNWNEINLLGHSTSQCCHFAFSWSWFGHPNHVWGDYFVWICVLF